MQTKVLLFLVHSGYTSWSFGFFWYFGVYFFCGSFSLYVRFHRSNYSVNNQIKRAWSEFIDFYSALDYASSKFMKCNFWKLIKMFSFLFIWFCISYGMHTFVSGWNNNSFYNIGSKKKTNNWGHDFLFVWVD